MSYFDPGVNIPPDYEDEEDEIYSDDFLDEDEIYEDELLRDELLDDSQEDLLDELGEYSDNDGLDPEEILYGEDTTDFDYAYYDNEDEWEGIEGQDEI